MKHNRCITPKQARFAEEYVVDFNATQAAVRAGYHKRGAAWQGQKLLKTPQVAAYVAELQKKLSERTKVDQERVTLMLLDSYEAASSEKQHGPAVRAAELLGKRIGMFKDVIVSEGLSDDQLIEKLAGEDPDRAAMLKQVLSPIGFGKAN